MFRFARDEREDAAPSRRSMASRLRKKVTDVQKSRISDGCDQTSGNR